MTENVGAKGSSSLFAGRYQLINLLGKGGMAEVFRASDTSLNSEIALKVLLKNLASNEEQKVRFIREARITRKIHHPNVVRTYDVGECEGRPFFAMELLEGVTLKQIIADNGALQIADAISIAEKILSGLEAIHNVGVVHRDIKPSNIVFSKVVGARTTSLRLAEKKFGLIKITDFGVAREDSELEGEEELVGSAPYMAPECWKKINITKATDLYAFGALFFEMLTGNPPFEGESSFELMAKHYEEPVPKAVSPHGELPAWVQGYLEKLLAKDFSVRFQNAGEALSVLFLATTAPENVEVKVETKLTSTTYKRGEYVADDQKVILIDESKFTTFETTINIFASIAYAGLAYFYLYPRITAEIANIQHGLTNLTSLSGIFLLAVCFSLTLIPFTIISTFVNGAKRSFVGFILSAFLLAASSAMYFGVSAVLEGIPPGAVVSFSQTKPGKAVFIESMMRVAEPALMLPPNSIGIITENKGVQTEVRTKIPSMMRLVFFYLEWVAIYALIYGIFFGKWMSPIHSIGALIALGSGFLESYVRSIGGSSLGTLSFVTPVPCSVSVIALMVVLLNVGLLFVSNLATNDDNIPPPQ